MVSFTRETEFLWRPKLWSTRKTTIARLCFRLCPPKPEGAWRKSSSNSPMPWRRKRKKGIGSRNQTALGFKSKVCNFQSRFLRERIGGFGFMRLISSPFLAKRRTQSGIRFPTRTGGSGREKNRLPETGKKTCLGIGLAEVENPCRASQLPNEPSEVSGKCSRSGNGPVRLP